MTFWSKRWVAVSLTLILSGPMLLTACSRVVTSAGIRPTPRPTLESATPDPNAARLVVYADGRPQGWDVQSYAATVEYNGAAGVFSGDRALQFIPSGPWSSITFVPNTPLDPRLYRSLQFAAKSAASGSKLVVSAFNIQGQRLSSSALLEYYGGDPTPDSWVQYSIPLVDLGVGSELIKSIEIQDVSGTQQKAVYLDEITLSSEMAFGSSSLSTRPAMPPLPKVAKPGTPLSETEILNQGFVYRSDTNFMQKGNPLKFVGVNIFDAAGTTNIYHCAWWKPYTDAELDAEFSRLRKDAGVRVIRFWAFQSYTKSGTDWSGIDRVIRIAKNNDLLVMPVLENQWKDCTEGGDKYFWFSNKFASPYGNYKLSYPEYVARIIERYRNEPAIFGWTLMNEAESIDYEALYRFTVSMSAMVKEIDPNHLLTLGTQATGQPGVDGLAFVRLYGVEQVDFIDIHDWGEPTDVLPGSLPDAVLPSEQSCSNSLACSMAQSIKQLKKPTIIGEAGIRAGPKHNRTTNDRARLLDAKMKAYFAAGGNGYVLWQWNKVQDEGFDFIAGDPVTAVLNRYSKQ